MPGKLVRFGTTWCMRESKTSSCDVASFDVQNTYLDTPPAELTVVEDECLSNQARFHEFHIRIPANAY